LRSTGPETGEKYRRGASPGPVHLFHSDLPRRIIVVPGSLPKLVGGHNEAWPGGAPRSGILLPPENITLRDRSGEPASQRHGQNERRPPAAPAASLRPRPLRPPGFRRPVADHAASAPDLESPGQPRNRGGKQRHGQNDQRKPEREGGDEKRTRTGRDQDRPEHDPGHQWRLRGCPELTLRRHVQYRRSVTHDASRGPSAAPVQDHLSPRYSSPQHGGLVHEGRSVYQHAVPGRRERSRPNPGDGGAGARGARRGVRLAVVPASLADRTDADAADHADH